MVDFATLILGADTTGLKKGEDALDGLARRGKTTEAAVARSTAAIGAAFRTIAVSMGGAVLAAVSLRGALNAIGRIDGMDEAAQSIDGTVNALRALQLAAGEAGIDTGALTSTMQAMNREIAKATQEAGPAREALKALGLSAATLSTLDADARLAAISDAMNTAGLSAGQASVLLQDLGVRSKEFSVAILEGGDAIRQARQDIADFGLELDDNAIDAVTRANDALGRMGFASEALGNQLAIALAPALNELATAFVNSMREGGFLRSVIDGLGYAMTNVLVPIIRGTSAAVGFLVGSLDEIGIALGLLALTRVPALAVALYGTVAALGVAATGAAITSGAMAVLGGTLAFLGGPAGIAFAAIAALGILAVSLKRPEQPAYDAAAGTAALDGELRNFYTTGAPSAGAAAIALANDNKVLAASAFEAASAQLALTAAALNNPIGAAEYDVMGNITGFDMQAEQEQNAEARVMLERAELALKQAEIDAKRAATAVTGSDYAGGIRVATGATEALTLEVKGLSGALGGAGAAGGAAGAAISDGMDEAEEAAKSFTDTMNGFVSDGIGRVVDEMVSGFKGGIGGIVDIFRDSIKQMIAFAIKNRITIALGIGGTGVAGAASAGGGLFGGGGIGSLLGGGGGAGGLGSLLFGGDLFAGIGGGAAGGLGGIVSGIGSAISAIALPLAGLGLLFGLFQTKTTLLASGIRVTVDELDVLVQTFQTLKKSRFFGLSTSVNTSYTDAPSSTADPITKAVRGLQAGAVEAAAVLGIGASAFADFTHVLTIATKDMNEEQALAEVQKQLVAMGDAFAGMADGLDAFERDGEGLLATLTRLSQSLVAVNHVADTLGLSFRAVGLTGADMASQLADAFGGLDALASATSRYYSTFYTEAERIAVATRQASVALGELGGTLPETRDEYRAMVAALDLTTDSGRKLFAALVGMADTFDLILPKAAAFSNAVAALVGGANSAIDEMISTTERAQGDALQAAKAWYDTARTLRDYISDLRGAASELISPAQAQAANQARFQMLLAGALSGNKRAADDLTGAAKTLLTSTGKTARTAFEAAKMQAMVMSDLQLAAGAADISGGAKDVVASLLGKQRDLLRNIKDYLAGGGVLKPKDIDALNGKLTALGSAIKDAEGITYASLKARIDMTVDLIEDANIPPSLRKMLNKAADGIKADLDFIVRAEGISPAVRFLALTNTSEHIKTVEFFTKNPTVPEDVLKLAVRTASKIAKTVNFVLGSELADDDKLLALANASELTRTINAYIPLSRRESKAVRLALATASTLTRIIDAELRGNVRGTDRMKLALAGDSKLTRMIDAELRGNVRGTDRMKLALAGDSKLTRMIDAELDGKVRGTDRMKLALAVSSDLIRTLSVTAGDIEPRARLLALRESSRLTRWVKAELKNPLSKDSILALATASTMTKNITAILLTKASDDAVRLALRGASNLTRTVIAKLGGRNEIPAMRLALATASAFTQTINALLAGGYEQDALDLALATGGLLTRRVAAEIGKGNVDRAEDLAFLEDSNLLRDVIAKSGVSDEGALEIIRALGGLIRRNVKALDGGINADALALAIATSGTITKTVIGGVDFSKLTKNQLAFLNSLTGTAAGTILLGGSFEWNPSTGFVAWYENATREGIVDPLASLIAPMSAVQDALTALSDALRAETSARVDAEAKAAKLAAAQAKLGSLVGMQTGAVTGVNATIAQIRELEAASGATIMNGKSVADLSVMDGLLNYKATGVAGLDAAEFAQWRKDFWGAGGLEDKLKGGGKNLKSIAAKIAAARQAIIDIGGVPGFAAGGMHRGGLRIVGERGPELEATGPARFWDSGKTNSMMNGGMEAMRKEMAAMREENRQLSMKIESHTRKTSEVMQKWDKIGVAPERASL